MTFPESHELVVIANVEEILTYRHGGDDHLLGVDLERAASPSFDYRIEVLRVPALLPEHHHVGVRLVQVDGFDTARHQELVEVMLVVWAVPLRRDDVPKNASADHPVAR